MEFVSHLKKIINSFSKTECFFLLSAMLCSFLICAEYAIVRPVSNSLFISTYGAKAFPYAWLFTLPLNFLIVALYNRYLSKIGSSKIFLITISLISLGNCLFSFFLNKTPFLALLLYSWKDVYILLLFQQLWSVIHSTIDAKRASYLYGILFGIGGIGAGLASLIPGFLAVKIGSERLLLFSLPIGAILLIAYQLLLKFSRHITFGTHFQKLSQEKTGSFTQSVKLILSSRLLRLILLIVIFMQLSSTLIDYQFNSLLETSIHQKDVRTEYFARIMTGVQFVTMGFQFLGTFLLVHFLGLRASHFLIPLILSFNAISFILFPQFRMISFSFITIKTFDFSIFGIIKEMLYIPLNATEKFQAKAIIDVFAYRTSKTIASLLILFLQLLGSLAILRILSWASLVVFILWSSLVFKVLKDYRVAKESNL